MCDILARLGNTRNLTTADIFEAAREIERLRKIETAARALKFSAYPAHGSGFVIQVSGGNIQDLEEALAAPRAMRQAAPDR